MLYKYVDGSGQLAVAQAGAFQVSITLCGVPAVCPATASGTGICPMHNEPQSKLNTVRHAGDIEDFTDVIFCSIFCSSDSLCDFMVS